MHKQITQVRMGYCELRENQENDLVLHAIIDGQPVELLVNWYRVGGYSNNTVFSSWLPSYGSFQVGQRGC